MVEFARIEVPSDTFSTQSAFEKTIMTQTSAMTESDSDPSVNFGDPGQKKALGRETKRTAAPAQSVAKPPSESIARPNPVQSNRAERVPPEIAQNPIRRDQQSRDERIDTSGLRFDRSSFVGNVRDNSFVGGTYSGSRTFTRSQQTQKNSSFVSTIMLVAIFGCLIGGGGFYFLYPERAAQSIRGFLVAAGLYKAPPVGDPGVAESSSNAPRMYEIAITSAPSGASIYIDGISRDTTPARLSFEEGKTVRVRLVREGYMPFEELVQVNGPSTVNAILHAEKKGYLDINVVGAGQIKVDGQLISTSSPANGVPVPADKEITVSAYDPVTKASDQIIVRVSENKVKRITLIPRARGTASEPAR
jgi:hypothetical protein